MKYPMIRKNGRLSSSLAAVTSAALSAGLLHTSPVFAQADGSAYEEVVVTARKRDEKLLEIPLSMTAISASDIEDKGITELVDLVAFTPGFFFAEHSVGRPFVPIRRPLSWRSGNSSCRPSSHSSNLFYGSNGRWSVENHRCRSELEQCF